MATSTRFRGATVVSGLVVCGVIAIALTGGTPARRPVRVLGAGTDPDAVGVDVSDVGVARPVGGTSAKPQVVSLPTGYRARPLTASFSTREQYLEGEAGEEEGEEHKPVADPEVSRSDSNDAADQPGLPRGGATSITLGTGFAGLKQGNNGGPNTWSVPPDTVGDVGQDVYVQAVNTVFAVYDKATGARLFGPAPQSDLFSSGLCANHDDGDPIVLYDEASDRFLLSQFAIDFNSETYFECISVSQDGNPGDEVSEWYSYAFEYPRPLLNDYPKFGVWPDGYYASFNQFNLTSTGFKWAGAGAIAYERDQMILGNVADQVYVNLFGVRQDLGGLLPSDWDSPAAPPAGMPNLYLMFDADDAFWGYSDDQVEFWAFHPDFGTPTSSTFTQLDLSANPENGLDVANFNPWVCGPPKINCIPQKNSRAKVDAVNTNLMNRLQYWNQGGDQHLVVNQTVKTNDGGAGVRWYEFRNTTQNPASTAWTVANQGTYGPGTLHRWMGSAAMNDQGDLAVGYSTSSARRFPGIAVAARTSGEVAKTLGAERKFFKGTGSEKGTFKRWGDYSALSVDPVDNCTFWYTQQYYSKTGQWRWATRIQPFTVSACT